MLDRVAEEAFQYGEAFKADTQEIGREMYLHSATLTICNVGAQPYGKHWGASFRSPSQGLLCDIEIDFLPLEWYINCENESRVNKTFNNKKEQACTTDR